MNRKPFRIALLAATIAVVAGCDPNPKGPSAPSAPSGSATPPRPDPQAVKKGAMPLRVPD